MNFIISPPSDFTHNIAYQDTQSHGLALTVSTKTSHSQVYLEHYW